MAIEEIPTGGSGEGALEQRTTLDGADFIFRFWLNQRESRWYLDLYDADRSLIAGGIKIRPNIDLLDRLRHDARRPPGVIMALDVLSQGASPRTAISPGPDDLGDRVKLLYVDAAELGI
jgi:hypothetical protein